MVGVNDPELSLYDLLVRNASERPDQPALIDGEASISHAEFLRRVDRLASGLWELGLQPGQRVALLSHNSFEFVELYGACARGGLIAAPINWRLTPEEIGQVIALTDPQAIVVGEPFAGLNLSIEHKYLLAGQPVGEFRPFSELYLQAPPPAPSGRAEQPFVIIPTAAVEGVPRGALLTQANLIHAGRAQIAALGLQSDDRHLAALPLFHIFALGYWATLAQAGGATVVLERFDPPAASQLIDQAGVTLLPVFPPVLELLLEARAAAGASWESLRHVVGLDKPEVIQRLLSETGAEFWTGFGQSETSGGVTIGQALERPGAAGRPLPGVELRIVDAQDQELPAGEAGEIVVRGPLVFAGYWNDPDATEYAERGGWHHTGDLGRLDPEGYLYYVGRKPEKELIKTGGENVYPAEVERVLLELPQVAAVCVFGVPDEKWGEAVKAVIELAPGQQLTEQQVTQTVTERIASYKKPRLIEFVETLPRTEQGQIDRVEVKASYS